MSFLKKVLAPTGGSNAEDGRRNSFSPRSPSMNDMSMGAIEDNEEYQAIKNDPKFMQSAPVANPSAIEPGVFGSPASPGKKGVWQGVFNPGRNFHGNMKTQGAQYWDTVEGSSNKTGGATIWDHVLHSHRHRDFDTLDKDKDGYLTANDLQGALGHGEDVKQLIAAADRNGDGRIDRTEFQELLKNSLIAR